MTTLAGVLGWPVAHSRSPAIHNAAYEALGLDWRYLQLPVPPRRLEETVRALGASGYRGANVTVPHKLAALPAASDASPAAREIGAANSLSFEDGAVIADNTDAGGFLDALGDTRVETATVLGSGGSARAVVWALRQTGAKVSVWNRTPGRARELAERFEVDAVERPGATDLLVNCTTVGLDPGAGLEGAVAALSLEHLDPPATVFDLVYRDGETPVCAWARRGGATVIDGLEMLVRQGARSFEAWTAKPAPLEVMRAAARPSG
jgi:shikimate dehydrogenase